MYLYRAVLIIWCCMMTASREAARQGKTAMGCHLMGAQHVPASLLLLSCKCHVCMMTDQLFWRAALLLRGADMG